MNSRGQAALEYLMTYGWALIVIAIVVGVLVFIVATPTGAVACSSSQPGKLNVISNNIDPDTGLGSIVVTNLTGGTMKSMSDFETGVFAGSTNDIPAEMLVGDTTWSMTVIAGTGTTGAVGINYTDPVGLAQDVNITCRNLSVA